MNAKLDVLEPIWQDCHAMQQALVEDYSDDGWERAGRPVWAAAASNILSHYVNTKSKPTAEVWLNLSNVVKMNPPWAGALAERGWRMPSAGEAFNQVSINATREAS